MELTSSHYAVSPPGEGSVTTVTPYGYWSRECGWVNSPDYVQLCPGPLSYDINHDFLRAIPDYLGGGAPSSPSSATDPKERIATKTPQDSDSSTDDVFDMTNNSERILCDLDHLEVPPPSQQTNPTSPIAWTHQQAIEDFQLDMFSAAPDSDTRQSSNSKDDSGYCSPPNLSTKRFNSTPASSPGGVKSEPDLEEATALSLQSFELSDTGSPDVSTESKKRMLENVLDPHLVRKLHEDSLDRLTEEVRLHSKPEESFISLISKAILSVPEKRMILQDIYSYVSRHFPYFKATDVSWQNAIRHNLSVNECFIKNGRAKSCRGYHWSVHPACEQLFKSGDFRRREARRLVQYWERSDSFNSNNQRSSASNVSNTKSDPKPMTKSSVNHLGYSSASPCYVATGVVATPFGRWNPFTTLPKPSNLITRADPKHTLGLLAESHREQDMFLRHFCQNLE